MHDLFSKPLLPPTGTFPEKYKLPSRSPPSGAAATCFVQIQDEEGRVFQGILASKAIRPLANLVSPFFSWPFQKI